MITLKYTNDELTSLAQVIDVALRARGMEVISVVNFHLQKIQNAVAEAQAANNAAEQKAEEKVE